MVNVKGEPVDKGGKCTMERKSPRPHTITLFRVGNSGIGQLHIPSFGEGGVTVEDPPISFSPFSLVDCTLLKHFSFNDFVAVAFPDIAGDLDVQI